MRIARYPIGVLDWITALPDESSSMNEVVKYVMSTLLVFAYSTAAAQIEIPSYAEVKAAHENFVEWSANAPPGVDFYATNRPVEGGADTTISLIVPGLDPDEADRELAGPAAWCEILFLHYNVKSCTHGERDGQRWLKMYMGRKFYQHPRKAEQIELEFNSGKTEDGVLWVELAADEGPFNTKDYYVGLAAIPTEGGVFVQFRSAAITGTLIAGVMDLYFATLASDKIGFSIVGTDKKGNPEYSGGTLAMLERNVVRYLIALDAYMKTYETGGEAGMVARTTMWFDGTEQYPEQLHEVERDDYLRDKRKEYAHQLELQRAVQ